MEDFKVTSLELIQSEQIAEEASKVQQQDENMAARKKHINYRPKMRSLSKRVCSYCWSTTSSSWRKGYQGVLMCEHCFLAGPVKELPPQPKSTPVLNLQQEQQQDEHLEDDALMSAETYLDIQEGKDYYATSAEDYSHSPYLTRTAVSSVRFDHSFSQAVYLDSYGPAENQLYSLPVDTTYYDIPGRAPRCRGTDAIECFLLGRCSQLHSHRYKSCDLSRFGNTIDFQREMNSVVRETYRVLKMGRRCTLGIGDNREHCFYVPVSFQMIRQYIDEGFELEELVVKRQRYCAMFGLGTYLCVQFDFLCFTHEFIATLRKVPKEGHDTMVLRPDYSILDHVKISSQLHATPSCPIERKSVVMGSVWTFKPTEEFDFPTLCASRMVERFGKNETNWEELKLRFTLDDPHEASVPRWDEKPVDTLPPEEDGLVSYERDRLQKIQENNRMLLALGLITNLGETSDDIGHQTKIAKESPIFPAPAPTALRLIAHIPSTVLQSHQITAYRTAIMHLALQAAQGLPLSGVLVIGAQDFRTETGKLIPLSMLFMEDVIRVVGDQCLKLKELIEAVPDGYQKDRRKITNWSEFQEEICIPDDEMPTAHLPIVHACYLVFTKVKEWPYTCTSNEDLQSTGEGTDNSTTLATLTPRHLGHNPTTPTNKGKAEGKK
ncbi:hypothetical protein BGZ83_011193 [Gryganskiella cystojenkinii]|nr:hypothetical protein BGZ83_011193 [Gryganskiella cystojenkinii]